MRSSPKNTALANRMRKRIQRETEVVSDGEYVAMVLLWSFLMDHCRAMDIDDIEQLAREQLEAFIVYARGNVHLAMEH